MPLLDQPRMATSAPPVALQQQDVYLPSTRETAVPHVDRSACLCGARLPLQVRLGFRSRTRPVLEGRWCCSESCLQARIASIVRLGSPQNGAQRRHAHRVPLGLLLLQTGAVTQAQLRDALEQSRSEQQRVGQVLVRDHGVPEQVLAGALAQQWGCGSWDLHGLRPQESACLAPAAVIQRTGMLPVRVLSDDQIGIAFDTDPDQQAIFALKRIHDRPVLAGIAHASQMAEARQQMRQAQCVQATETECENTQELVREIVRLLQRVQPIESRWARLHNIFWMRLWLEPAALAAGPINRDDVLDHIVHLPSGFSAQATEG